MHFFRNENGSQVIGDVMSEMEVEGEAEMDVADSNCDDSDDVRGLSGRLKALQSVTVFVQVTLMSIIENCTSKYFIKGFLFLMITFRSINRILSDSSLRQWKVFGPFSSFAFHFSLGSLWLSFLSHPSFFT